MQNPHRDGLDLVSLDSFSARAELLWLSFSYILLIHCAFLDFSGFPFQSGLSSVLATEPVRKCKVILRQLEKLSGGILNDNSRQSNYESDGLKQDNVVQYVVIRGKVEWCSFEQKVAEHEVSASAEPGQFCGILLPAGTDFHDFGVGLQLPRSNFLDCKNGLQRLRMSFLVQALSESSRPGQIGKREVHHSNVIKNITARRKAAHDMSMVVEPRSATEMPYDPVTITISVASLSAISISNMPRYVESTSAVRLGKLEHPMAEVDHNKTSRQLYTNDAHGTSAPLAYDTVKGNYEQGRFGKDILVHDDVEYSGVYQHDVASENIERSKTEHEGSASAEVMSAQFSPSDIRSLSTPTLSKPAAPVCTQSLSEDSESGVKLFELGQSKDEVGYSEMLWQMCVQLGSSGPMRQSPAKDHHVSGGVGKDHIETGNADQTQKRGVHQGETESSSVASGKVENVL